MTELEQQLQASVTRLEVRKGEPWRPWEHCEKPCRWHDRCRMVERVGNGAECHWLTHQPGVDDLSHTGRRITAHALKLQRGERAALSARTEYIRECDADYFTGRQR